VSAQETDEEGRAYARAEAELVRAALLEAGVPEERFTLTVESDRCPISDCGLWHTYVVWDEPDTEVVWKAFQLATMKLGTRRVACRECWNWDIGDDCMAVGLELDCGLDR
jgi:hypothetical protein